MALDRRHRWNGGERSAIGPRIVHTCRVCGKVESFEIVFPDVVALTILDHLYRPNPYRLAAMA